MKVELDINPSKFARELHEASGSGIKWDGLDQIQRNHYLTMAKAWITKKLASGSLFSRKESAS